MHALLVPLRDEDGDVLPGIAIEDCGPKLGLDGVDNGRIAFDHVRVPRDGAARPLRAGARGRHLLQPDREPGEALLRDARDADPGPRRASAARRSPRRRSRSTSPCGTRWPGASSARPAGTRCCCWTTARTSAACCPRSPRRTRCTSPRSGSSPGCTRCSPRRTCPTASGASSRRWPPGSRRSRRWHATDTIQACREACGGAGYLRSNRFAALKADTDVFTTFEGDNTVLLQLAAKNLLTDYRDQFGELDPLGVATFVAGQVLGTIAERRPAQGARRWRRSARPRRRRPARPRRAARAAALAPGAHPRRASRGGSSAGSTAGATRSTCSSTARTTSSPPRARGSTSWCSRRSPTASSAARTPRLRALLDRLCSLYALSRVEAERGWYQEHGRLTRRALEGGDQGGQRALRGAAARRRAARRRLRRARAGRAGAAGGRRSAPRHEPPAAGRARAPDARRRPHAVRRARVRGGDHGRGRGRVGVTKPLLYAYFGNKERLYLACMEPAGEALVATVTAAVRDTATPAEALRARRARVLRLRRSRPQRLAGAVRRDAARRRASPRAGRPRSATG